MSKIQPLDCEEFRRRIAGLSDAGGGEDLLPEEYRELAGDYVLLLAICFNRRALDALTLWKRIDGAIEAGLAGCDGDDIERFVSIGLGHVMADVSISASNETALDIQSRLYSLDDSGKAFFIRYLAEHRYPAIVFGRAKYNSYKESRDRSNADKI